MAELRVNKAELARRVLKCSLPTLDAMLARWPDFPIAERGSNGRSYEFVADDVVKFLAVKRDEAAKQGAERAALFDQFTLPIDAVQPDESKGMTPAEREKLAKARMAERKLALESGLLVSTAEERQALAIVFAELGKFLDGLPGQLAREFQLPDAVGRAMRARLDDQRRQFVRKLADRLSEEAEQADQADEFDLRDGTTG